MPTYLKLGSIVPLFRTAPAVPAVVPSAPTLVSVTPGLGTLAVVWSAPFSDGGSPVTAYVLERAVTTGAETARVTLGVVLSHTDIAEQNRTYFYKVKARNAVGTGAASNELSGAPLVAPFALTPASTGTLTAVPATPGVLTLVPAAPVDLGPLEAA